ncbi:MAG: hypothetical protein FWG68_00035 [Defluviitaleaceae bacterium]|nr:hypothetical protein [Defluviitaleaceae bacterium]
MKKRVFTDENYDSAVGNEILDGGICVACPKCGGMGVVKGEERHEKYWVYCKIVRFKCTSCYHSEKYDSEENVHKVHRARTFCEKCEKHISLVIDKSQHGHKVLNIVCPHCGAIIPTKIQIVEQGKGYMYQPSVNLRGLSATDNTFGYELYFLSAYKGRPVFATNRLHLQYLIDYIGADLRKKPYRLGGISRRVPGFMKLAKNREEILRILRRLQEK